MNEVRKLNHESSTKGATSRFNIHKAKAQTYE